MRLTHLLRKAASLLDWTSLGRSAALWGTRITPTYRDAFLGDKSRLTSINGEPLTYLKNVMLAVNYKSQLNINVQTRFVITGSSYLE